MKAYIKLSIFLILLLIFTFAGCKNSNIKEKTYKTTVDKDGDVGADTSLLIRKNKIYISYSEYGGKNSLRVAISDDFGKSWIVKKIDTTTKIGGYSSTTQNENNIYLSYWDYSNEALKFASSKDEGKTWEYRIIDNKNKVGQGTSIVANGDYIFISYYDSTIHCLKCAISKDEGKTWNIKIIDSNKEVGYNTSIAINNNIIFISYDDEKNNYLKYAISKDLGNTWKAKVISTDASSVIIKSSIKVKDNNMFISYYNNKSNLAIATSNDNGETWFIKAIDKYYDNGGDNSLIIDNNEIYISYLSYELKNPLKRDYVLKLAYSNDLGETWNTVELDDGWVGDYSSIGILGDKIFISYNDAHNNSLKFIAVDKKDLNKRQKE